MATQTARRPERLARLLPGFLITVCLLLASGCAGTRELAVTTLEAALEVTLEPAADGGVEAVLTLAPVADERLLVLGERPFLQSGDDARLILRLELREYPGSQAMSYGRTRSVVLPFGPDGEATLGAPLSRRYPLELKAMSGMLARKVTVAAVLHPVDVVVERQIEGEDGPEILRTRNGGAPLSFPAHTLRLFPRTVDGPAVLADPSSASADDLFLAAAGMPREAEEDTVGRLIALLDEDLDSDQLDAVMAALLYLTDIGHGQDVARWKSWWRAHERASGSSRR